MNSNYEPLAGLPIGALRAVVSKMRSEGVQEACLLPSLTAALTGPASPQPPSLASRQWHLPSVRPSPLMRTPLLPHPSSIVAVSASGVQELISKFEQKYTPMVVGAAEGRPTSLSAAQTGGRLGAGASAAIPASKTRPSSLSQAQDQAAELESWEACLGVRMRMGAYGGWRGGAVGCEGKQAEQADGCRWVGGCACVSRQVRDRRKAQSCSL